MRGIVRFFVQYSKFMPPAALWYSAPSAILTPSAMIPLLLAEKIGNPDYCRLIEQHSRQFANDETALLAEIVQRFSFDVIEAQALVQAVIAQSRFDPNALHLEMDDDEDVTGICPHCLNPPVPPLRDYELWRQSRQRT